jgi:hypothetical protein
MQQWTDHEQKFKKKSVEVGNRAFSLKMLLLGGTGITQAY